MHRGRRSFRSLSAIGRSGRLVESRRGGDRLHSETRQSAHLEVQAPPSVPLAVDLDGTLIFTDMLLESLMVLLAQRPLLLFLLPFWLLKGRAAFKQRIAERVRIDFSTIPVNEEFCAFLREEKMAGRRIGLFSAADDRIVKGMADRIGLFDVAVGSDGRTNLSGAAKRALIAETLGPDYVYAGNAPVDLDVWRGAKAAIVVCRSSRLQTRAGRLTTIERVFSPVGASPRQWVKALRVHQWAKNLLVFVPLLLSAPTANPLLLVQFALAFLTLNFLASATYLLNDLVDLEADRKHRSKRHRPFASGAISIASGILALVALALLTGLSLLFVPKTLLVPVAIYLVTTLAYSFAIKRVAVLDALCLGFLFTVRIAAGAALLSGPPPHWLFAFSMFFFTSLALVKRHTEINALKLSGKEQIAGRGYQAIDLPFVLAAGIGMAVCAIVVFLIYLGDQHFNRHLFSTPGWLALSCAAMTYWLMRIWLLTVRDEMHDDPIFFALRDRVSIAVGATVVLSLLLAW